VSELPDLPGLSGAMDQLAPMRELMGRQAQETNAEWLQRTANEPPTETSEAPTGPSETPPVENISENVGEDAIGKVGEDIGEKAAEDIGEKAAVQVGEKAVESTIPEALAPELALDFDPITAIFGAILGIGTLIAGAAGANSIKNPSIPKLPPVSQVATQFGIGN